MIKKIISYVVLASFGCSAFGANNLLYYKVLKNIPSDDFDLSESTFPQIEDADFDNVVPADVVQAQKESSPSSSSSSQSSSSRDQVLSEEAIKAKFKQATEVLREYAKKYKDYFWWNPGVGQPGDLIYIAPYTPESINGLGDKPSFTRSLENKVAGQKTLTEEESKVVSGYQELVQSTQFEELRAQYARTPLCKNKSLSIEVAQDALKKRFPEYGTPSETPYCWLCRRILSDIEIPFGGSETTQRGKDLVEALLRGTDPIVYQDQQEPSLTSRDLESYFVLAPYLDMPTSLFSASKSSTSSSQDLSHVIASASDGGPSSPASSSTEPDKERLKIERAKKTIETEFSELCKKFAHTIELWSGGALNEKHFKLHQTQSLHQIYTINPTSRYATDPRAHYFCLCLSTVKMFDCVNKHPNFSTTVTAAGQELFDQLCQGSIGVVPENISHSHYFLDEEIQKTQLLSRDDYFHDVFSQPRSSSSQSLHSDTASSSISSNPKTGLPELEASNSSSQHTNTFNFAISPEAQSDSGPSSSSSSSSSSGLSSSVSSVFGTSSSTSAFQQYEVACQEREAKKNEAAAEVEKWRAEIVELQKNTPTQGHRWGFYPSMHKCAILDRDAIESDRLGQALPVTYAFGSISYKFYRPSSNIKNGTEAGIKEIDESLGKLRGEYKSLDASCNQLWKQSVHEATVQLAQKFPQYLTQSGAGEYALTDVARQMSRPRNRIEYTRGEFIMLRAVTSNNEDPQAHTFMACYNILLLAGHKKDAEMSTLLTQEGNDILQVLVRGESPRELTRADYNTLFINPQFHQTPLDPIDASQYDLSHLPQITATSMLDRIAQARQVKDQSQEIYNQFIREHSAAIELKPNVYDKKEWSVTEGFMQKKAAYEITEKQDMLYEIYEQLKQKHDGIKATYNREWRRYCARIRVLTNRLKDRFPEYLADREGYSEPLLTPHALSSLEHTRINGIYVVKLDTPEPERSKIKHFITRYNALIFAKEYVAESVFSSSGIAFIKSMLDQEDELLWTDKSIAECAPLDSYNNLFVISKAREPEPPIDSTVSKSDDDSAKIKKDGFRLTDDTVIKKDQGSTPDQEDPIVQDENNIPEPGASTTKQKSRLNNIGNASCCAGVVSAVIGIADHYKIAQKELVAERLAKIQEMARESGVAKDLSVESDNKETETELQPITYTEIKNRVLLNIKKKPIKEQKAFFIGFGLISTGLGLKLISKILGL